MWQQIVAILAVLALLGTTLHLLRRRGFVQFAAALGSRSIKAGGRPRQMQVIERIALGPQQSLHLVNVRDTIFLIGVSPAGCNKLGEFRLDAASPDIRELSA